MHDEPEPELEPGAAPPDLLDYRGRLRRFTIAAAVAVVVGFLAGSTAYELASAEPYWAWKLMFYTAALAGGSSYTATHWLLRRRARRRDQANQIPAARVRRS